MSILDTNLTANLSKVGSPNCLPIGTRLADFEITGIVGEGGFGIVYLAFDHSLQRTVAIKEYMPAALAGRGTDKSVILRSQHNRETFESGLKGFINEARLLAQFDHPSLIKVYRFWEQNNTGYMVMQYYEGLTLKELIKSDPALVTETWLKSILRQILDALNALHESRILHRDISPDNIMIQKNGAAVLLDFGAARQIIGDMTQALTVILKPGYAPIEQYADDLSEKQGPWTDIYALSAVVYSAIAGKIPPTSVARVIKDPIEPLQGRALGGFSTDFLSAIDKGLSVRPENRPQSISVFRELLRLDSSASPQIAALSALEETVSTHDRVTKDKASQVVIETEETDAKFPSWLQTNKKKFIAGSLMLLLVGISLIGGLKGYRAYSKTAEPIAIVNPAVPSPDIRINSISKQEDKTDLAPPDEVATQPLPDEETGSWQALQNNNNATPDELAKFIQTYPSGKYTELARARLSQMEKQDGTEKQNNANAEDAKLLDQKKPTSEISRTVRLTVKPWGKVWVDGVSMGVSPPLKKLALTNGKHQIRITNPNFPDYISEIEINKNVSKIDYSFLPAK